MQSKLRHGLRDVASRARKIEMTQVRNLTLWVAGTASAVLFADAALSFYKVLEFRAAFPSSGVLQGILVLYIAVASASALIVYAALTNLQTRAKRALLISAAVCIIALAVNFFSLPDMAREALDGKNLSLGVSLFFAVVLELWAVRLPLQN